MKPSTMRDYDTMERLFLGHLLNLVHDVAGDNNNDLSLSVSSDIVHDDCLPATQDNFVYLTLSGHPSLHAVAIQRSRNPITELFVPRRRYMLVVIRHVDSTAHIKATNTNNQSPISIEQLPLFGYYSPATPFDTHDMRREAGDFRQLLQDLGVLPA